MPQRDLPLFSDLRDFMDFLEAKGQLVRISEPISVAHEITEIHRRVLQANGPALLFERPIQPDGRPAEMPVLVNLFGTVERVAWGCGVHPEKLRDFGEALAELRDPRPPQGLADAWSKIPLARAALAMRSKEVKSTKRTILTGDSIDLGRLPVQICWPGEPSPLITWPLVMTRPPESIRVDDYNVGVYRVQVLDRDGAIMRWLAHRGGARHHHRWKTLGQPMPAAVVIGADPSTILSAVIPLPESLSELRFSGLLRGQRPRLMSCTSIPLLVPAEAEIVIEGYVSPDETAPEGPFGDHTGYYNAVERFPVMQVTAITMRPNPIYLSTFTGRAPDEPSRIGEALNEMFVPILKRQFPEVRDAWLPPEACSYRIAIVSIAKRYAGQARRVMLGLWSLLPQFTYTKLLILVDEDIDIRSWDDVMWAVATRSDPSRDLVTINDTPIDYLDFASPKAGLGGKLGIDATNKIASETSREWGEVLRTDAAVTARVDALWEKLGLHASNIRRVA
ncbi:3-octaprenyl-4-hydroxybenzoate carboxy-lyase [Microvirga vignae]|uniref:3-octaprenyl-4-hydroxybenzoate carboxy-lyase n=1 Tax=Microvirga vignae TaxID=1225564 RepID=A0A0H1RK12_9HYPH|nr:UbiD family decarboxylase [Microvirga vignae]KLK92952.1 3-octaprenyl-4-hydroxybenzoate carboxy-lyase [Microvirga vignae]